MQMLQILADKTVPMGSGFYNACKTRMIHPRRKGHFRLSLMATNDKEEEVFKT